MPNTTTTSEKGRLVSLDVFRGITIAAMVLVNNPGSWEHVYWPLEHAQWHGWTPTDLVFPFFLFIVGVAITLAFGSRVESGRTSDLYLKIVKRSLIIFGIGLFLNALPHFGLSELRIPGVLQRIAVCYFFASILFLTTKPRTQVATIIALLVGYWLLVKFIPAPGFAAGDLTKEGSLPSFVDRLVFGKHVWAQAKVYDPEGLLSTIPALATTLIGVLTGRWLRSKNSAYEKVAGLFVAGAICVAFGWAWNSFFPINKALWTSSYVLFTGGWALQFLALCYWVIDIKGYRWWAKPFEIFGLNAIALYVVADLIAVLLDLIHLSGPDGSKISLGSWVFEKLFASWASPLNASLAFAITFVLVCLGLMWVLYRRKIFIKA
ncbi:MAG TPA: heparan-alpha-glucosaminide N-acetyltransferase domain-containing protein [Pyrinomonadaceae bacterium]|jgi:predicted acyltransferase|nr:heparan-alpha-glucosaminide N-acetyltransferase domain-containing protein [Pyrinomonadaceae bacterium]